MKNEIPIFFAVDDNYIAPLAVTIQSLVDNSSSDNNYKITVLYTHINDENKKTIKEYEKENISIDFYDISEKINGIKSRLYTRDYFSDATYYRLFIPELYNEYQKAVYLDCDLVLLSDVADLYNIDMEDNLIMATPDGSVQEIPEFAEYVEKVVGMKTYKNYFNAGVIVMNLDELRKFNFLEKFIYLLDTIKFAVAQDQDYLNRLCKGRVKIIPDSWDRMPLRPEELPREKLNLVHYNFASKPWLSDEVMYQDYFWEYAKKTKFYDYLMNMREEKKEEHKKNTEGVLKGVIELCKKESSCVGDDR